MKLAADFREIARNVLRGKWPVAILTGFLASVMGACIISNGGGTSGNTNNSSQISLSDNLNLAQWRTTLQVILGVLILWIIATLIVSGAGKQEIILGQADGELATHAYEGKAAPGCLPDLVTVAEMEIRRKTVFIIVHHR